MSPLQVLLKCRFWLAGLGGASDSAFVTHSRGATAAGPCFDCVLSRVRLFVTPWTLTCQALPSLGFSKQEYWGGLPFPPPGDRHKPGIATRPPATSALEGGLFTTKPAGKPTALVGFTTQAEEELTCSRERQQQSKSHGAVSWNDFCSTSDVSQAL
ncbi:unnamed protein product [Rangifer tarandus platyrhynchus]|uniref:Secreted protein n=1 Tax=Rangifer tarandus platyrhynchus TaxID=3082113 RepID=A0ABN8Z7K9_RANTA|nr:unnamed protein product [Rangifer tarandus platyrhynchus]